MQIKPDNIIVVSLPADLPELNTIKLPKGFNQNQVMAIFYLIHLRTWYMQANKKYAGGVSREEEWVPLPAKYIKIVSGAHYKRLIEFMVDCKWIEIKLNQNQKMGYSQGKFTGLYRIHANLYPEGRKMKKFRRVTIRNKKIIDKLRRISATFPERVDFQNMQQMKSRTFDKMKSYADLVRIDMDNLVRDLSTYNSKDDRLQWLTFASYMNNAPSSMSIDTFGKRAHSIITQMPSGLRNYAYFDTCPDEELVMIDIRCSQPLMLSYLLLYPKIIRDLVPEFRSLINKIIPKVAAADAKILELRCREGMLYNEYMLARGRITNINKPLTEAMKSQAKNEIFSLFYSKGRKNARTKSKVYHNMKTIMVFQIIYPTVWNVMNEIKNLPEDFLPFMKEFYDRKKRERKKLKSASYLNLSCMLQRIESQLVRDINEQMIRAKLTPFVTIHDCWILPKRFTNQTLTLIQDYFKDLGISPPGLKVTELKRCDINKDAKKWDENEFFNS